MRLGEHRYLTSPEAVVESPESDYDDVIKYVRSVAGIDFSMYRETTIRRRILRRAMLFGHDSIGKYLAQLKQDEAEVKALHLDLLINVTSFFRDAALFEALELSLIHISEPTRLLSISYAV